MEKSIIRFCKKDFREPTTEKDIWASILKNYGLPEDTEFVDFLRIDKDVKAEITKQVTEAIEECK